MAVESPLRRQRGAALVLVLLGILVFVAAGAFIVLAVDRNTDLRFAFQRNITGFHSAEAGIHVGAVGVVNTMQNFALPTNCGPQTFTINGRTVTYTLSVPTNAPWNGTPGSCQETPLAIAEAQGTTFGGLNAQLYTYDLTSSATNTVGFTEATINNQFQVHLIPMFQFAAFYAGDMEVLPGPTAIVNGRLHAGGDVYLNNDTCGAGPNSGLNLLGQLTIVGSGRSGTGPLNRGRKDDETVNHDNVYISLDGTTNNLQVLGTDVAGDTSCAQVPTRQIGQDEINSFNTLGQRVVTGIKNINLPNTNGLICTPWMTGCGASGGSYWQNANLILALDTTTTAALDGSTCPSSTAPCLYPIEVLNQDGSVNGGLTQALAGFMRSNPGAITYTDVPRTANSNWNCKAHSTCETLAYNNGADYTTAFPQANAPICGGAGFPGRTPRTQIKPDGSNYCNDYRYGGFYNWRERKPMLIMNIDWMALEEYNLNNGNVFYDPTTTTNGGLVVFLTIKDTPTTEGAAADHYAVRIYDAARARYGSAEPGVTFASDRAMYLAGNFNCPQPTYTGSDSSPAACGDAQWPPSDGSPTDQKAVSVVADTIDVLSCNWVQAQVGDACNGPSGQNGFQMDQSQWGTVCGNGCRPVDEASTMASGTTPTGATCGGSGCHARETIVNAAFLAGTDQTWCASNSNGTNCGQTYYSGGVENFPRYHEDWSGTDASTGRARKFWYQGSLVSSGPPSHTCFAFAAQLSAVSDDPSYSCSAYSLQGFWTTQRYSPPTRRWFYDVSFNDSSFLPPLTPRFTYLSQVFFTQVFQ